MIKPEIYYEVTCDMCGRKYTEGDTVIALGSKAEAALAAIDAGWHVSHRTEAAYCPDCVGEMKSRKDC